MCGIVGYIGPKEAYPIIVKGLKRLEYRGYDSAGIVLDSDNNAFDVAKTKGKVDDLVAIENSARSYGMTELKPEQYIYERIESGSYDSAASKSVSQTK